MKKILLSIFSVCLCMSANAQNDKVYSEYIEAVDEYVPAPGQFIGMMPKYAEGDDAAAMVEKCTNKIKGNFDKRSSFVCMGAWGGYMTFHFDHPIVNKKGEYDFMIQGNAIDTWAEPGIVMVSEDGKQWYELSGSADVDSIGKVIYDYEITYERQGDLQDVKWTDNKGESGFIHRNKFHQQEYFPEWVDSPITFEGTRLPDNAYDSNAYNPELPENWIGLQLRYGYADNYPAVNEEGNSFKIDWAVDENRQPVVLDAIQYVRVQTGINQNAGWTGEHSTEIGGAKDLHLDESIAHLGLQNVMTTDAIEVERYNSCGMLISTPEKGLNIVKYSDGTTRKIMVK